MGLGGPTEFHPVIKEIKTRLRKAQEEKKNIYYILLILTDGGIHDMRQTIDEIIECSELPLSIIIIGIGDGDFKNMEILDADDTPLYHSNGTSTYLRDIVQFVRFEEFRKDGKVNTGLLAEDVLKEVPDQFVSFMHQNLQKPIPKEKKHDHNKPHAHHAHSSHNKSKEAKRALPGTSLKPHTFENAHTGSSDS